MKKYIPRLKTYYQKEIVPEMIKKLSYTNTMQVPKISKISINQGLGEASRNKKILESALQELSLITGQKAVVTLSKKDISNFKLRKGMAVGIMVTLRNDRMYEFLDRLIAVAIPRIRDFRGLNPKSFDGRGNYTLGILEQIIFPEIDIDKIERISGMDINIVTNAGNNAVGFQLLKLFGLPFKQ